VNTIAILEVELDSTIYYSQLISCLLHVPFARCIGIYFFFSIFPAWIDHSSIFTRHQ
jgi:hypothetical protein